MNTIIPKQTQKKITIPFDNLNLLDLQFKIYLLMFKKGTVSTLLGVFVLMIGVLAGVILVDQVQDFRNKAKEKEIRTFSICHKNQEERKWEQITVEQENLEEHLNHGDILGECPED
ncbi:hypothetical protein A2715_02280 [Candidatus Woesebacteria bacterium RIFCSPHIGHO2_01_FULL_39_32]|uniref:Uncharacterized protein n=1 Tax=Candidatus Woesebacteria bacterium RIFCSPLOWO2_01_FULL_39_25 TaxID=1802521 RepID=A0A1F8BLM9_9BACT|nr:MAG: hypothetical protein A2124_01840 [Candidatus Woesebacteria bacterium GWB1_37_5]OGM23979.1 MAG: hypothetical protein A2715_02280 [Candidatus Woesebacteria bacterium RIFCSPHIGHO2_01_FULL_39_32]OGM37485.1 MAG: hypothetical protein A3F01_03515 [Candidatus Woesebacteria bacterium RIFCSPHIGHO2_12_FULL_38_11]OGM64168.1 MAG: hypothetical protein A2893_03520 [Candidatus Woesebacteria bacterium RIFCSPLOWO2_01_FULL_39_25]